MTSSPHVPEDLVPLQTGARIARVSRSTFYRWILAGRLPVWERCGRRFVSRADVMALYRRVERRPQAAPSEVARNSEVGRRLREAGLG